MCSQLTLHTVSCARFSLEQSQTRGDRLETRLEAALLEMHSRPALQPQASEEGLEEGAEGGGVNTSSAAKRGGVVAEDKSNEVRNIGDVMQLSDCIVTHLCRWRLCKRSYKR